MGSFVWNLSPSCTLLPNERYCPMNTQKIFTIGEPCHEDWNVMTPTDKGRFCDSCAKCVVDLRGKSQPEIQNLFEIHEGNLCGSMTPTQYRQSQREANLALNHAPATAPISKLTWNKASMRKMQIFAASFLAAFGFLWSSTVKAQNRPMMKGKMVMPRSGSVDGNVTSGGKPAKNVEVQAASGKYSMTTQTDAQGNFRFAALPPGEWNFFAYSEDEYMEGSAVRTISAGAHEKIKIKMEEMMMMGDVAVYEEDIEEEYLEKIDFIEPIEPEIIEPHVLGGISFHEVEVIPEIIPVEVPEIVPGQIIAIDYPINGPVEVKPTPVANDLKSAEAADITLYVEDFEVTVHPVPTRSELNIRIDKSASEEAIELFLFSVEGELVRTGLIMGAPGSATKMDLSNLAAGIYFLKGLQKEYLFQKKVLKL